MQKPTAAAVSTVPNSKAVAASSATKMSDWDSFAQFDAWADQVPPGQSKTRRASEEASDNSWWKAAGIRKQRISDYRKLLSVISQKAADLTAKQPRFRSRVCSTAEAAAALDEQCRSEGLNLCSYFTKYLKAKGSSSSGESSPQPTLAAAAQPAKSSSKRRR